MPSPADQHYAHLLSRARNALEKPSAISPSDRAVLVEDLTKAEGCAHADNQNQALDVHVATIAHCEGVNHYAAFTRDALLSEIAAFCREWWHEIPEDRDPVQIDDESLVQIYFDKPPTKPCRLPNSLSKSRQRKPPAFRPKSAAQPQTPPLTNKILHPGSKTSRPPSVNAMTSVDMSATPTHGGPPFPATCSAEPSGSPAIIPAFRFRRSRSASPSSPEPIMSSRPSRPTAMAILSAGCLRSPEGVPQRQDSADRRP